VGEWDFALFGDGSGSVWSREAGWASVLVERETRLRYVFCGGVNLGTVNFAEIMAFVHPMTWLLAREEAVRREGGFRAYRVHVFTDSEYAKSAAELKPGGRLGRMKNVLLLSLAADVRSRGFVTQWHWLRRATNRLHDKADEMSKITRALLRPHRES
jgi:ribonuclease HI